MSAHPETNSLDTVETQCDDVEGMAMTGVRAVASYNGLDEVIPKIAVSGQPPLWEPPSESPTLEPDTGSYILDHNLHHFPDAPMIPAIQALLHENPEYYFSQFNVISDRQPLADLLDIAYTKADEHYGKRGKPGRKSKFFAHIVGNTVIFTRGDGKEWHEDNGSFSGFRKGFESHFLKTSALIKDAATHFHLSSYSLGRIKMLVRHSVDARKKVQHPKLARADSAGFEDTTSRLRVQSAGEYLFSEDLIEINTFANLNSNRRIEKQREAWLSGCGTFIAAGYEDRTAKHIPASEDGFSHKRGAFPSSKMEEQWAPSPSSQVLSNYYDLLNLVLGAVRNSAAGGEGSMFRVTYTSGDVEPLITASKEEGRALTAELCERLQKGL